MNNRLDLAVVESRWWDSSNDSVRGLFDMLAGLHRGNPFAYHYEMFSDADSLRGVVKRIARQKDIHNIYIAAHGTGDGNHIKAADGRISRVQLRNMLRGIHSRTLHGLFLGTCNFGQQTENIVEDIGLTWIAGYRESVDWVNSSAMDLYFWNAYFRSSIPGAGTKLERADRMAMLLSILYYRVPYMFRELGFQVTLAPKKGIFITFPGDGDWEGIRLGGKNSRRWGDAAKSFIEKNPDDWP